MVNVGADHLSLLYRFGCGCKRTGCLNESRVPALKASTDNHVGNLINLLIRELALTNPYDLVVNVIVACVVHAISP
jgi:hypothetical protein